MAGQVDQLKDNHNSPAPSNPDLCDSKATSRRLLHYLAAKHPQRLSSNLSSTNFTRYSTHQKITITNATLLYWVNKLWVQVNEKCFS